MHSRCENDSRTFFEIRNLIFPKHFESLHSALFRFFYGITPLFLLLFTCALFISLAFYLPFQVSETPFWIPYFCHTSPHGNNNFFVQFHTVVFLVSPYIYLCALLVSSREKIVEASIHQVLFPLNYCFISVTL